MNPATPSCRVCGHPLQEAELNFYFDRKKNWNYAKCSECQLIARDPSSWLSSEDEKARYDLHQNDLQDLGYRNYLQPLRDQILMRQTPGQSFLDFGCGPQSYFCEELEARGFRAELYDLFYFPQGRRPRVPALAPLERRDYDFMIVSEVIEHLRDPLAEFRRWMDCLKPGGRLWVMTQAWASTTNFADWAYRRDATHVHFFSDQTFRVLAHRTGALEEPRSQSRIFSFLKISK